MDLEEILNRDNVNYNIQIKSFGKHGAEISVEGNKFSLMVGLAALVSALKKAVEIGLLGDNEAKKIIKAKKEKWNKIIKLLEED